MANEKSNDGPGPGPFVQFEYSDGRAATVRDVEMQCGSAYERAASGLLRPKTPEGQRALLDWCAASGLPQPGPWEREAVEAPRQRPSPPSDEPEAAKDAASPLPEEDAPVNATDGALRIAEEHGLDLSAVTGSGKDGRVTVYDVNAVLRERDGAP